MSCKGYLRVNLLEGYLSFKGYLRPPPPMNAPQTGPEWVGQVQVGRHGVAIWRRGGRPLRYFVGHYSSCKVTVSTTNVPRICTQERVLVKFKRYAV